MYEFNCNRTVKVKLTPIGIAELKRQHQLMVRQYNPPLTRPFIEPETDKEGWSSWQLHDLMSRFGDSMVVGMDVPFETAIRFEEKDMKPITND